METQLRRREQEFASRRELLSAQLEAAIFSANERDNEALMRNQEARKEVRAAKRAAADYVLNDAQRREFSLKAGWCARYYHLFIALGLGPVDEDVREEASVWTESFGITPGEGETHESIVKRIDAVFVEAAKRPVASYEVETSLVPSPSDLDDDGGEPAPESEPVDSAKTSLPTSLNPSWPTNFRHAVSVEIAMRHLVAARIEQRVVVALADTRRANVLARLRRSTTTSSTDDSSALSDDEMNEFHFRRAWLRLMWARAREAGIDLGIADEREDHWLARMKVMTSPEMKDPSHFKRDALAIDKGLKELRSTLVESRLWRQV
ncbi:unnamed product [Ostreococcus tauri]|uniref:Unnamed product n=1 Tax=Ostreococcus tauri TaxID=70448 RepID=A0A096PAQ0_OSTTA|nr:unnamed product [Ostreococcus tauri]CEG01980.1 unnamed product [Ostreococcus tauri]|eukprot:XP_003082852.2 unnamed product [Ostreococcus tauri]